jgi:hypothetical protein
MSTTDLSKMQVALIARFAYLKPTLGAGFRPRIMTATALYCKGKIPMQDVYNFFDYGKTQVGAVMKYTYQREPLVLEMVTFLCKETWR